LKVGQKLCPTFHYLSPFTDLAHLQAAALQMESDLQLGLDPKQAHFSKPCLYVSRHLRWFRREHHVGRTMPSWIFWWTFREIL